MFGRLADNKSNAMAQILYGLALRHGWGIEPDPGLGITYLSRAATMSADVESDALAKGVKKGGAAKGELVLAIYELANSFRHGWGAEKDPVAARKYYEVAANLGDTDAMNECGWCYDEGYGGKKDRVCFALLVFFFLISFHLVASDGEVEVVVGYQRFVHHHTSNPQPSLPLSELHTNPLRI